jgi:hypothetical protein
MTQCTFSVIFTGAEYSEDLAEAIHAAGCTEATLIPRRSCLELFFDGAAESYDKALDATLDQVKATGAALEMYAFGDLRSEQGLALMALIEAVLSEDSPEEIQTAREACTRLMVPMGPDGKPNHKAILEQIASRTGSTPEDVETRIRDVFKTRFNGKS